MIAPLKPLKRNPAPPPPVGDCLNCGKEVSTPYCPFCGQENEPLKLGFRDMVVDMLEEVARFDSRLFQTLKVLFLQPGRLSREWALGRRTSYITPLKLYLSATFLFFLISSSRIESITASDDSGQSGIRVQADTTREGAPFFVKTMMKLEKAGPREVVGGIVENMPKALFVMLPVFALGLKLIYWRKGFFYVEHLVFALHNHAFYFLVLSLALPIPWSGADPIGFLICIGYFFISLKKFYDQGVVKTAVKGGMLGCGYSILLSLAIFAAMFLGAMSLPDAPNKKPDTAKTEVNSGSALKK